jgi:hypothetical protein
VTDSDVWDLSAYSGIHLSLGKTDGKKYTFVIKDEVLPLDAGGREQSTISWEYVSIISFVGGLIGSVVLLIV